MEYTDENAFTTKNKIHQAYVDANDLIIKLII